MIANIAYANASQNIHLKKSDKFKKYKKIFSVLFVINLFVE